MYNESCKTCGQVEGAHLLLEELLIDQMHNKMTDQELDARFSDSRRPCEHYESEISHLPRCPVVVDDLENQGREIYCQDISGGCESLIEYDTFGRRPWE